MSSTVLQEHLKTLGNSEQSLQYLRFFKTAPGQYGFGDQFYGIKVPILRKLVSQYFPLHQDEISRLLNSSIHEERFLGLQFVRKSFEKSTSSHERQKWFDFSLTHLNALNNWDLVDTFVEHVIGAHLFQKDTSVLFTFARSPNLWHRRIAIISTFYFIRHQEFVDTLALAKILLHDKHDLIHKAVGWMLREVGKRDEAILLDFLETYAHKMPRTMLRYALEKLSPKQKGYFMQKKSPIGDLGDEGNRF